MIPTLLSLLIIGLVDSKPSRSTSELSELLGVAGSYKKTVIRGNVKFNIVIDHPSGASGESDSESDPSPCSKCRPIYLNDACEQGYNCVTANMTYKMGRFQVPYPYEVSNGDENTCSLITPCPPGSSPSIRTPLTNRFSPVPLSMIVAMCQETGVDAGHWYFGHPIIPPVGINGVTCQMREEPEQGEDNTFAEFACPSCESVYGCFGNYPCLTVSMDPDGNFFISMSQEGDVCSNTVTCPVDYQMKVQYPDGEVVNGPASITARCDGNGGWKSVIGGSEVDIKKVSCTA